MNFKNTIKRLIPFCLVGMLSVAILSSCQEDTRPLFYEKYTEKCDQPVEIVFKYNLSNFVKQYQESYEKYPTDDISDLISFHGMASGGDAYLGIADLLRKNEEYEEGCEPEVFFRYQSALTQKSIDFSYTKYDESLCDDGIIKNAPRMNNAADQLEVVVSAHTIKTRGGVEVKWIGHQIFKYSSQTVPTIKIKNDEFDVNHSYTFITKGSVQDHVAGRSGGDTQYQKYELLPNMIPAVEPGKYEISNDAEECLIPSVLTNSVCKGGRQVEEIKWEAPTLLKIEKISK